VKFTLVSVFGPSVIARSLVNKAGSENAFQWRHDLRTRPLRVRELIKSV